MLNKNSIFIDKNSKTGILLFHGFGSSCHEFYELVTILADKGFTTYAPSIAGHGTSLEDFHKSNPRDWKQSAKEAYLKLQGKCKKIFIIGDSFGASLALWLVKEFNNEPAGIAIWGTPVFIRNEWISLLRLYSYGWFCKYYTPRSKYDLEKYDPKTISFIQKITYPSYPVRSLRNFLKLIKKDTVPYLSEIKIPVFIAHSNIDPVIHPKSAEYMFSHLGSFFKKLHWFKSDSHILLNKEIRDQVYDKMIEFIEEVNKGNYATNNS